MIVSISEARKLIGDSNSQYTDKQIEEIVNIFTFFTDIAIDSYIESIKKKEGVITHV